MASTTPLLYLPYPQAADGNNTPLYIQGLAEDIEAKIAQEGNTAARNALTARQGMRHWTTDGGGTSVPTRSYRTSTAWVNESRYSQGLLSARPAANTVLPGHQYFSTDNAAMYLSDGTNWHRLSCAAGTVAPYLGGSVPEGHVLSYGQVVSRTGVYADLFAAIGTIYNTGGEAGTDFRLADLRGVVTVFLDNMGGSDRGLLSMANTLGLQGGEEKHTMQLAELATHSHTVTDYGHIHGIDIYGSGNGSPYIHGGGGTDSGDVDSKSATSNISINNSGSSTPFNVMQPYILVNGLVRI